MSSSPAILALDLGTSSLKALVVDREGRILIAARRPYPTAHPEPGFAVQDPEHWWEAAAAALAEVRGAGEITAIAVTGQMHGTVLLDAGRRPLTPAIIWADERSAANAARLTERVGAERLSALAGSPLASGFQAATLAWLRERRADLWRRIDAVVLPKDWLAFRLTGTLATEPSDAAGTGLLDSERWRWAPLILDVLDLDQERLPPITPSGTAVGRLTPSAAEELELPATIPVILAGGDAPCGAVAAGVVGPDRALVLLSSGAQVIQAAGTYRPDPEGRFHVWPSAMPGEPRWNRMGATLSAGLACEWLATVTGEEVPALLDRAAAAAPGAGGLLFLPYLSGERTPLMDPGARGGFLGLHAPHGTAELARAVVEGIAFAVSEAVRAIVEGPTPPREVLLGGARHPLWRHLLADALGLPVRPLATVDLSAYGAAMLAAHHLDWLHLPDDAHRWRQVDEVITPDVDRHEVYRELSGIHHETYRLTRPLVERLKKTKDSGLRAQD